jgi:hypothetical protein
MPMCLGQAFEGELRFRVVKGVALQEVRLEIRVRVEATVSSGKKETIEVWRAQLLGPGRVEAGDRVVLIKGALPALSLPTIELPHGKAAAVARVTFARAWARDWHIDRDIALATTSVL